MCNWFESQNRRVIFSAARFERPWGANRRLYTTRRYDGLENGIDIIRSPRRRLTQQQFRFEQFRFVVTKICQWFASSRPAHFLYTFPSAASLRLASIVNIIPPPRPRLLQGCATVAERELPPPDTRGSPVTKSRLCSTYVFRDA